MQRVPYKLAQDDRPKIGVIVLEADETLEDDLRQIFPLSEAKIHITRIPSDPEVTVDTLASMEKALPNSARLFPSSAHFQAVGYGCTSGTTIIGAAKVTELVQSSTKTDYVSNPLTATLEALRVLGVKRLGIVSPYIEEVAEPLRKEFQRHGFEVPAAVSFGESSEEKVARIDDVSLKNAAQAIVQEEKVDAVFMSCTNLRTLGVIAEIENEIGIPVLSSNQTLTWHLARLSGLSTSKPELGMLWTKGLSG